MGYFPFNAGNGSFTVLFLRIIDGTGMTIIHTFLSTPGPWPPNVDSFDRNIHHLRVTKRCVLSRNAPFMPPWVGEY